MKKLSMREKELVSIGAALGSNCVPCIIYHIRESRKSGISDAQITEAIELAAQVRKVQTDQVLSTAYSQLGMDSAEALKKKADCGCR